MNDPPHIERIQSLIIASLKPVRPLPSDRTLRTILLLSFAIFSLLATIPVGYKAFHALDGYTKFAYYSVILLCATWCSIAIVQEMIPGSKRRTRPATAIFGTMLVLALLASILFHSFDLNRFVPLGIPCLRLGIVCALLSGALFWLICRKGFFASPRSGGATVGSFAGLAGVAVLALHCPIENSVHILAWHLGVMVIAGTTGAVVALVRHRVRRDTLPI